MLSIRIFKKKEFTYTLLIFLISYLWRFLHRKSWLCYAKTKTNLSILKNCPTILKSVFLPTIYLQHTLLQTMFAGLVPPQNPDVRYDIEEVKMKKGGHTSLAWAHCNSQPSRERQSKVLIIIVPGITGSCDEKYAIDLVSMLSKHGYRSVVYQTRLSGKKLVLPSEGHVDLVDDFRITMDYVKEKNKGLKLFGIGHSYGANLLVNYLGTHTDDKAFIGGVSLANPYNFLLAECKARRSPVDKALAGFLQETVSRSKKELTEAIDFKLNMEELQIYKTMRVFDENITIKMYGYETADEYYWGISSCRKTRLVKVPLFMLQAEDDPIAEAKAFIKEDIEKNPNVLLMMTPKGGHQGWIEGFFSLRRWYLQPVVEFVNAVVDIADI